MKTAATHSPWPRFAAAAGLTGAALVVVLLLVGGSSYRIHAHFLDAGQLVKGGQVEIAGHAVGSIADIGVTPDGQADVVLSIDDSRYTPLHAGTRATIRALSQTGVANHYVALTPGPSNQPALHSGAGLDTSQTSSMVSLDAILDAFGPAQRADLEHLLHDGAGIYAGSGAHEFNAMLDRLDPATARVADLTGELAGDTGAISQIITMGDRAASAIASRRGDLTAAVANTATALHAIATRRDALADALTRAPAVFDQARTTLGDTGAALTQLRPTLNQLPPAAAALAPLLRAIVATVPAATPVTAELSSELPPLTRGLKGLTRLEPLAVPALTSAAQALKRSRPIVRAVRFYGADLFLGIFLGLAGTAPANYDRWGHYARIEFTEPYQSAVGGALSSILLAHPLTPSLFNLRSKLLRRCPGGNTPPAPDGSNPWVPDPSLCTPADDVPLSVDFP